MGRLIAGPMENEIYVTRDGGGTRTRLLAGSPSRRGTWPGRATLGAGRAGSGMIRLAVNLCAAAALPASAIACGSGGNAPTAASGDRGSTLTPIPKETLALSPLPTPKPDIAICGETSLTIRGIVFDRSLSAKFVMLSEPVDGVWYVGIQSCTRIFNAAGEPIALRDIERGSVLEASGVSGAPDSR